MKILKRVWRFIKRDPVFIGLAILLCMHVDWEWTNIKSFITGGVISASAMLRIFREMNE